MAGNNPFPNPYPAATPQLLYKQDMSQPLPGTTAATDGMRDFVTGVQPDGYSVFGCLVVNDPTVTTTLQGGIAQGIKHPASSGDITGGIVGIVVRSAAMETRRDGYPPSYSPGDVANVQRAGRMWTKAETATTVHGAVYARVTANGSLTQLGALRADNDSGNAVLVPNCYFMDAATLESNGATARVEYNFVGQ